MSLLYLAARNCSHKAGAQELNKAEQQNKGSKPTKVPSCVDVSISDAEHFLSSFVQPVPMTNGRNSNPKMAHARSAMGLNKAFFGLCSVAWWQGGRVGGNRTLRHWPGLPHC